MLGLPISPAASDLRPAAPRGGASEEASTAASESVDTVEDSAAGNSVVLDYHRRVHRLFKSPSMSDSSNNMGMEVEANNHYEGGGGGGGGEEDSDGTSDEDAVKQFRAPYGETTAGAKYHMTNQNRPRLLGLPIPDVAMRWRRSNESARSETSTASYANSENADDSSSSSLLCTGDSWWKHFAEYADDPQLMKRQLSRALERGRFGTALEVMCLLAVFVGLGLYISESYNDHRNRGLAVVTLDALATAPILIEWVCNLIVAEVKLGYVASPQGIICLVATLPSLLELVVGCAHGDCMQAPEVGTAAYALVTLRVLRILRGYFYRNRIKGSDAEVQQAMYVLCFVTAASIMITAAILHGLEFGSCWAPEVAGDVLCLRMEFHDALYLSVITVSTVGYGDIYPQSTMGKITVVLSIAFTFVTVPTLSNHLINLLSEKSLYARARFKGSANSKHVVVTGSITSAGLTTFLDEFYHPDHGNQNSKVVILHPQTPSSQILAILKSYGQLQYIEGSAMKHADLKRAQAHKAQACFVLSNQLCLDKDEDDASNSLKALALKHITNRMRHDGTDVSLIVQLHRSGNKDNVTHCLEAAASVSGNLIGTMKDQILCLDELKLNLLGMACMCPGINALVSNLISSRDDSPPEDCENHDWQEEYCHGCGFEIYCDTLGRSFHGMKLADAASIIKKRFETVIFAVELWTDQRSPKVVIAPLDHVITKDTVVYFLSEDSDVIKKIATYGEAITLHHRSSRRFDPEDSSKHLSASSEDAEANDADRDSARIDHEVARQAESGAMASPRSLARSTGGYDSPRFAPPASMDEEEYFSNDGGYSNANAKNRISAGSVNSVGGSESDRLKNVRRAGRRSSAVLRRMTTQDSKRSLPEFEALYHSRDHLPLKDALVDHVDERWEDHVILYAHVGTFAAIAHFAAPLRRKAIKTDKLQKIIVIVPEQPDSLAWSKVCKFSHIYVMIGHAYDSKVLRACRIEHAQSAVVLATSQVSTREDAEMVIDTDSIFSFQNMKRMAPDLNVVVELIDPSNVAFMIPALHWSSSENFMAPPFAAGYVYTSAMLDTIVCQSYYNPNLFSILRSLLGGSEQTVIRYNRDAANDKFYHQGYLEQIELADDHSLSRLSTYGELYDVLLKRRNRIAIGLYRDEGKGSRLPYVYTNPSRNVQLHRTDSVFVLVHVPIDSASLAAAAAADAMGAP